jgi:transcriptional regulator GlxA family with amidase domain
VRNLRIGEAKRLLEGGDRPVEDVSAAAGNEDASLFRRAYRRSTGPSPGRYRRMFDSIPRARKVAAGARGAREGPGRTAFDNRG